MEARTTETGETLHVDESEALVGSKGPFYRVYRDAGGEDPWGFYCTVCGTFDNAMDTMARIVCNACANTRKPEEWDAAHE